MFSAVVGVALGAIALQGGEAEEPRYPRIELRADALVLYPFGGRFWSDERSDGQGGPHGFDMDEVGGNRWFVAPRVRVTVEAGARDRFEAQFAQLEWSGGQTLARGIGYDGKEYAAGTRVSWTSWMQRASLWYAHVWAPREGERSWEFSTRWGFEVIDYKNTLRPRSGANLGVANEDLAAIFPLAVGVELRQGLTPNAWLALRASGAASINQGRQVVWTADRLLFDLSAEVYWRVGSRVEVVGGVLYSDIRLRLHEHRGEENQAKYRMFGPTLGLTIRW